MDQLNAKSAGLLTHISIMIAAIAVLYGGDLAGGDEGYRALLLVELCAYTVLALLATRCLLATSPRTLGNDLSAKNAHERFLAIYGQRRAFYGWCVGINGAFVAWFIAVLAIKALPAARLYLHF